MNELPLCGGFFFIRHYWQPGRPDGIQLPAWTNEEIFIFVAAVVMYSFIVWSVTREAKP